MFIDQVEYQILAFMLPLTVSRLFNQLRRVCAFEGLSSNYFLVAILHCTLWNKMPVINV